MSQTYSLKRTKTELHTKIFDPKNEATVTLRVVSRGHFGN
jgi:hypothetical protein